MNGDQSHHPSCSSRWGGLCSGCPTASRTIDRDHEPDITCRACGETYLIAAENPIARARALRDWPGCDCTIVATPEAFDALDDALNRPPTVRERLAAAIGAHGERTTDTQRDALGAIERDDDGKQTGVRRDRARQPSGEPDEGRIHVGSGVLDRARPDPSRRTGPGADRGLATDTPAATGGDTPAAGATTSRVMARWVSGRPGWIVRRQAVAW